MDVWMDVCMDNFGISGNRSGSNIISQSITWPPHGIDKTEGSEPKLWQI